MKVGKIVVGIIGGLVGLVAIGLVVGGAVLTWAFATQRDADGFLTSPTYGLSSSGHALVSEQLDIASHAGDWLPSGIATIRFEAESDGAVFVGIGPSSAVDQYLGDVSRDEVTRLGDSPTEVAYRHFDGGTPTTAPGEQGFWVASGEGPDGAVVEWEIESGDWTVVAMNADGSAGVAMDMDAGVHIPLLLAIAVGILVAGIIFGALAALALVWATRKKRPAETVPPSAATVPVGGGGYPVTLVGQLDPNLNRGLWLIKWFLAIPHYVALAFLWVAFALLTVMAFFAIAFTGRYPRGMFDFNVGVLRWTWRVGFYAFSAAGTDRYPPFTLEDVDYPARLDIAYPEKLSRGLVWVKSWLLAIPHLIIVGFFTSGLVWWTTEFGGGSSGLKIGGGLIGILVLIALLALLFTGRYPQGLFDLVMGLNRWAIRVGAYVALMRDEYPPFRLDIGAEETPAAGERSAVMSG